MYSLNDEIEIGSENLAHYQHVVGEFLQKGKIPKRQVLIPATNDLFAEEQHRGKMYVIQDGMLSWCKDDAVLLIAEPGDMVGIEEVLGFSVGTYATEFAIKADCYEIAEIEKALRNSPEIVSLWSRVLSSKLSIANALCFALLKGERRFVPEIRSFKNGETIITQGTAGDEVFTLLSGHADVLLDDVKVGEVFTDEIFGALAALTNIPRTATVVASEDCKAIAVSKSNFLELMRSRPAIVLKMVEDMARTIVDLNKKVVGKVRFFR